MNEMMDASKGITWPQGKKSALVLTFDMDTDVNWVNMNADYHNGDKFVRSISMGQYGPKSAVPRILDLLDKYGLKATFFVPGRSAELYQAAVLDIANRGHEIGDHGYVHERFVDLSAEEQEEILLKDRQIFKKLIGKEPVGFRSPSGDWSMKTPVVLNKLGFLYSSSMRGDDRPYRTVLDDKETDLIELSAQWYMDDWVAFLISLYPSEPAGQDRSSGIEVVLDNWKKEFDGYRAYGLCQVLMMHPQVIGRPGQLQMLDQFLEYVETFDDVWIATGEEVSVWWKENN